MTILMEGVLGMRAAKIAISIESALLERLDHFVENNTFKTRSDAIQTAINQQLKQLERVRLAQECEKLNRIEEQQLADEGLQKDGSEWPEF